MKYTLTLIATLLVCLCAYSQSSDTTKYVVNQGYGYQYKRWKVDSIQIIPHSGDTTAKDKGQLRIIDTAVWFTDTHGVWRTVGSGATDLSGFIRIQSQAPTASLSGGIQQELMDPTGSPLTYNLTWGAGRLAAGVNTKATAPIASVLVNGLPQVFAQPPPGGSVGGTQSVSVPRNATTTFQNIVTTTDNKSASASTTFIFSPKRYFGWVSTTTPTDGNILALPQEFSTSRAKDWVQSAPDPGGQRLAIVYPANEGPLSDLKINGFPSIEAFTLITRDLTNAAGFTQPYNIYVSINLFTVTGTTTVSTQ